MRDLSLSKNASISWNNRNRLVHSHGMMDCNRSPITMFSRRDLQVLLATIHQMVRLCQTGWASTESSLVTVVKISRMGSTRLKMLSCSWLLMMESQTEVIAVISSTLILSFVGLKPGHIRHTKRWLSKILPKIMNQITANLWRLPKTVLKFRMLTKSQKLTQSIKGE